MKIFHFRLRKVRETFLDFCCLPDSWSDERFPGGCPLSCPIHSVLDNKHTLGMFRAMFTCVCCYVQIGRVKRRMET